MCIETKPDIAFYYITLQYVTLRQAMSLYATLRYVTLHATWVNTPTIAAGGLDLCCYAAQQHPGDTHSSCLHFATQYDI